MPELSKSGVYVIKNNVNGKVYVGSSVDVHRRWILHKSRLNRKVTPSGQFVDDWHSMGGSSFSIELILECCGNFMKDVEEFYIKEFNSTNPEFGYNICKNARDCSGLKQSDETREKRRQKMLGRKPSAKCLEASRISRMTYVASEETRRKISEAGRGRIQSDESRRKKSVALKAHREKYGFSDETRKKISEAKKKWHAERRLTRNGGV